MINIATKFVKEYLTDEPSFIFVGPPSSGKTVYFTCAMDRIKILLSENPASGFSLETDDAETLKRHKKSLADMKKGHWPAPTQDAHKLFYNLSREIGLGGRFHLATMNTRLVYHDYPGEAFQLAFDEECADSSHWEREAEDLRRDIQAAKGIFIVIDTPALHNGENEKYMLQLFSLLKFIETESKVKNIGVIFTKKDMFEGDLLFNPEEQLKCLYLDTWLILKRKKAKYFFVSAVAKTDCDHQGNQVPPKGYMSSMSENLVDPLAWALGITL